GAVLLTSGCTAAPQRSVISAADRTTWSDRMDAVLHDPSGQGGASGLTPGSVMLESVKQGTYELVSACTGVDIIHVTARAGGKVLAETDVPCGAAVTVSVTYDVPSPLELRATAHSRGA